MFDKLDAEQDSTTCYLSINSQLKPRKAVPTPKVDEAAEKLQQFAMYKGLGNTAFKGKRLTNAIGCWVAIASFQVFNLILILILKEFSSDNSTQHVRTARCSMLLTRRMRQSCERTSPKLIFP